MNHKIFFQALLCLLIASCHNNKTPDIGGTVNTGGNTITLSEGSPALKKIKTVTVEPLPYSAEFKTIGTVKPITGRFAKAIVPFDGHVKNSYVSLGQRVRKGQPLFSVASSDFSHSARNISRLRMIMTSHARTMNARGACLVSE